jgi:hypothetical protein
MGDESRLRVRLLRDAVLTLVAVAVAWLALDDITTDAAGRFPLERVALLGCGSWFAVVAWGLVRRGHPLLGVSSLLLVAAGALAQMAIGPDTVASMRVEYLATLGALAWFVLLTVILTVLAARPRRRHAA